MARVNPTVQDRGSDRDRYDYDYDVAVIGGGPGGSCAAIGLRRAGWSVLLLEAESFPRFHIGESLLPQTNLAFRQLGIYEAMRDGGYMRKNGATFIDAAGEREVVYDFEELTDLAPVPTYQVLRSDFDARLLRLAAEAGATVRQGRAKTFAQDPRGATLGYVTESGTSHEARVAAVIDASGRAGFLARQFGVRRVDPGLQKAALHGHFHGVSHSDGRRAGDIRIVSLEDLGWVWVIPLAGGITSVGLVLDLEEWKRLPKNDPERQFLACLDRVPAMRTILAGAELTSAVRVESSFSYSSTTYAANRWLLVGDAGSFLDPVFSSGVTVAILNAVDAAEAIGRGLRGEHLDPAALRRYHAAQVRRYRLLRRFVVGFYRASQRDLFFHPRPTLGALRAVATLLAGGWEPGFLDRRRIDLFYGLGRLQGLLPIVPRMHGRSGGPAVSVPRAAGSSTGRSGPA